MPLSGYLCGLARLFALAYAWACTKPAPKVRTMGRGSPKPSPRDYLQSLLRKSRCTCRIALCIGRAADSQSIGSHICVTLAHMCAKPCAYPMLYASNTGQRQSNLTLLCVAIPPRIYMIP
jgi:hypothetical protein